MSSELTARLVMGNTTSSRRLSVGDDGQDTLIEDIQGVWGRSVSNHEEQPLWLCGDYGAQHTSSVIDAIHLQDSNKTGEILRLCVVDKDLLLTEVRRKISYYRDVENKINSIQDNVAMRVSGEMNKGDSTRTVYAEEYSDETKKTTGDESQSKRAMEKIGSHTSFDSRLSSGRKKKSKKKSKEKVSTIHPAVKKTSKSKSKLAAGILFSTKSDQINKGASQSGFRLQSDAIKGSAITVSAADKKILASSSVYKKDGQTTSVKSKGKIKKFDSYYQSKEMGALIRSVSSTCVAMRDHTDRENNSEKFFHYFQKVFKKNQLEYEVALQLLNIIFSSEMEKPEDEINKYLKIEDHDENNKESKESVANLRAIISNEMLNAGMSDDGIKDFHKKLEGQLSEHV